jgi:L-asparaginase II
MTELNLTVAAMAAKTKDFVELAEVTRGELTESWHRGIAVLTGPDGKIIAERGNAKRLIYPRSAIKPLQTLAMVRSGMKLEGAELAITSASHRGTDAHLALVRSILAKAGLEESDLQCPEGIGYNCSGKHAGFLTCEVINGWNKAEYLSIDNPMQTLVIEVLEEFSGEKILHSTVDGCGAPLHSMTVEGVAKAMGKFCLEEKELFNNLIANGWVISNHGVPDAILLDAGFLAKNGAEGVFVVATRQGHGIAIKIADGSLRAAPLIAIKLLHDHQLITDKQYSELHEQLAVPVLGGGKPQGEIIAL